MVLQKVKRNVDGIHKTFIGSVFSFLSRETPESSNFVALFMKHFVCSNCGVQIVAER